MAEKEAKFSKTGGKLELEISIEENQTGTCQYFVFDKNDNRLQRETGDKTINIFQINSDPKDLDGALLMWDAVINGPDTPNQKWKVTMKIRQDGQTIEGGVITNGDPP